MAMFNLSATTGVSGGKISFGIHKGKFNGLVKNTFTSQNDGKTYNTMELHMKIDGYGDWSDTFYEPTSDVRTTGVYGENPSQSEQFMIALRQIFDALSPTIGEMIDNDNVVIADKKVNISKIDSFDLLVRLAIALTNPYIGKEVEIKIVPNNKGYAGLPKFPAGINRNGNLYIVSRFIGQNLTLSNREKKQIDAINNATPTPVSTIDPLDVTTSTSSDQSTLLSSMESSLESGDDLPF